MFAAIMLLGMMFFGGAVGAAIASGIVWHNTHVVESAAQAGVGGGVVGLFITAWILDRWLGPFN